MPSKATKRPNIIRSPACDYTWLLIILTSEMKKIFVMLLERENMFSKKVEATHPLIHHTITFAVHRS